MLNSNRLLQRIRSKQTWLVALLLVLTLVMAACGGTAPAADAPAADAPAADAPAAEATEAPAEEAADAPAEEERLGSTLIGEIEGPDIITDESAFPTSFSEAPMLADAGRHVSAAPVSSIRCPPWVHGASGVLSFRTK